ncbi:MAG: tRNA uridine-5-carboxymethylaminomethyl(34) synthesis GTPase MnmE [Candidatus Ventricola sp.]|nr:tRNA uridine-5-carboxymethylaminomethyl(34) synthesis GTPase MnmE [Candidatus Ventricola sp.]
MLLDRDIIAAQATAPGEGGIAIVRLSGEGCEGVLLRVFRPSAGRPLVNRRLTFGHLLDGDTVIDEAMAVMMRAPHSYTREDVAEIHCHGSQALVSRVLALLLREGVRMARPGEFTCRAFLNGRIDLTQAEAVMRMIRAGSDRALRSAVRQLEGGVSAFVREAREEITAMLAALCAAVDFPDEVDEQETAEDVRARCLSLAARLRNACDPRAGRMEDEGLRVVLCGRPNAGKSSLLNALLGGERAIVTDIPGTTRDTLSESLQIDGLRVVLTDTAGLRETGDAVERIGVARAQKAIAEADVRVLVVDASVPLCEEEDVMPDGFAPELIVLNKSDLPAQVGEGELAARYPDAAQVTVCCVTGEGLDRLRAQLVSFAPAEDGESSALTQARHAQAALRACKSLDDADAALADGMPLDVAAVDLSAALDALGEITGETLREDVLDEIFSRFCVGK